MDETRWLELFIGLGSIFVSIGAALLGWVWSQQRQQREIHISLQHQISDNAREVGKLDERTQNHRNESRRLWQKLDHFEDRLNQLPTVSQIRTMLAAQSRTEAASRLSQPKKPHEGPAEEG